MLYCCVYLRWVCLVISIFLYAAAFALGVIMLYCCVYLRWVCLMLNIVGGITLATSWVLVVMVFRQTDLSTCLQIPVTISFGVGFVVFLVTWVLDLVNVVFLFIPWRDKELDKSSNSKEDSDHSNEDSDHSNEDYGHSIEGNSQEE
ncbi:putative Amastin surface glycoprotein [Leishmania naiffi]|uniref:Amastin surface glycoprotein n=1 Tax=Leishmania naiffi TaxID=5678 RepID=A0AAW3CAY5_9TRYP